MKPLFRLDDGRLHRSKGRRQSSKGDPACATCGGRGVGPLGQRLDEEECPCVAAYQEKLAASGRPVLTQFEVLCEVQTKVYVTVYAEDAETAWQHAKQSKHRKKTVQARPTWIDTAENATKLDELKLEHVGDCNGCRRPVFEHDDRHPDWPWSYASDPNESEHSGKILCYPCAKERGVE